MLIEDLRRFDLNLLVVFQAMMAERNVSRAASRLLLGQPAVSHALARLREAFDDRLFVRAGGLMQPTPRAVELAASIGEVLEDIRGRVLTRPHFDPASHRGTMRIGVSDYAEVAVMRPALLVMRQEAPFMRVVMRQLELDEVVGPLESGLVDLGVGVFPELNDQLRHQTLFEDDFACAFDARACGVEPPLSLEQYLDLPHVLLSPRGDLEGILDPVLREAGLSRFVFASTTHLLTIPWLLRDNRAVAVLPRRFAQHCAYLAGLAISDMPIGSFRYRIEMAWHPRTDEATAHRWLRGLVQRASADGEQSPPASG